MRTRLVPKPLLIAGAVALPLAWFACSSTNSAPEAASSGTTPAAPAASSVPATPAPAVAAMSPKELEAGFKTTLQPFVQTYCVTCHGGKNPEAELDLSKFDTFASVTKNASRWHEILGRVKNGEMPPDDAEKHPTAAQTKPVVAWLESMHAAEVARTAGDPGMVLARRLSNAEFDYTIRDLTGANIRPTKEFPVDPANAAGFDNSGESLAMSPSMVQKYLEAARSVADHVVFTTTGLEFAEYPTVTREDGNKYAVNRIVEFYNSLGKTIDTRYDHIMARSLEYADFIQAAWRYQNRAALNRPKATLADFATEAKISPKYLQTLWTTLNTPAGPAGPLAALQARWKKLPAPVAGKEPETVRKQSEEMRDFIIGVRGLVRMQFANAIPNGRIIAEGSPTMVTWKDHKYADNRLNYAGNATKVDFSKYAESDPALLSPVPSLNPPAAPATTASATTPAAGTVAAATPVSNAPAAAATTASAAAPAAGATPAASTPAAPAPADAVVADAPPPRELTAAEKKALAAYEEEFKRFCAVFPDAFYVTERARMYLANTSREIATDLGGHRLLTAGFHSGEGYFRDDQPLYNLVLDDAQKKELDRRWADLEYIARAPKKQYEQFLWYERGEPPSVMVDPAFAAFRAEDESITSEAKIKALEDVYVKRVETVKIYLPARGRGGRGGGAGPGAAAPARPDGTPAPAAAANAASAPKTDAPAVAAASPNPAATPAPATPTAPTAAPAAAPAATAVAASTTAPAAAARPATPSGAPAANASALAVNTPLNFIAPSANSANTPPPPDSVEFKLSAEAIQGVRDYFTEMNARIRALEVVETLAPAQHLKALADFAERAARRPLSKAEKDDILGFYQQLRKENLSHEDAIRDCIVSILMAPSFNFRADIARTDKTLKNGIQPLSDVELANRLSYFLWSSMPDAELMAHARKGDLHQPAVLAAQAHRMLQDDRIQAFATEFGANWLDVRRFEEHNAVDRERFPTFTNDLREAMFQEPIRFITDLVQRNGSIFDFIYGDYTFVNGPLAKHYGMPEPAKPDEWVRVDGAGKYQRGGLLPMSVFLTKNAPGLRTSPVKRGHWVVTKILGERIPAPPPNVPAIPNDESKLGGLTLRETLAKHRQDKTCASCHNKFDSFGLVFEGYGPVGETRELDLAGRPTETTALFPDGSEGSGLAGLRNYIHTKVEPEFVDNISRKLLVYALGRSLMPSDEPVLDAMRRKLAANGYRFENLVTEIVTSRQFLNKRVTPDTETISAQ